MVRTNQGGSVLGFVAIGVVLAVLLVGGVYVVRQQSKPQPASNPVQHPVAQAPQQKSNPTQSQPKKQEPQKPAPKKDETPPKPAPAGNNHVATQQLPTTGPAETIGTVLALGLLSGTMIAYVRSRRFTPSL